MSNKSDLRPKISKLIKNIESNIKNLGKIKVEDHIDSDDSSNECTKNRKKNNRYSLSKEHIEKIEVEDSSDSDVPEKENTIKRKKIESNSFSKEHLRKMQVEKIIDIDDSEKEDTMNREKKIDCNSLSKEQDKIYPSLVSDLKKENYFLLELLGKGEFGVVYKAIDKKRKNIMAFKIIKMDPEILTREEYLDEGLILKKLSELNKNKFLKFYGSFTSKEKKPEELWLAIQAGEAALSDILEYRKNYTQ